MPRLLEGRALPLLKIDYLSSDFIYLTPASLALALL